MLAIQTLGSKNEVLTSMDVEQGELTDLQYIDAAIKQAKELLHSDGFAGVNVKVIRGLRGDQQTVWMTYYRGG